MIGTFKQIKMYFQLKQKWDFLFVCSISITAIILCLEISIKLLDDRERPQKSLNPFF